MNLEKVLSNTQYYDIEIVSKLYRCQNRADGSVSELNNRRIVQWGLFTLSLACNLTFTTFLTLFFFSLALSSISMFHVCSFNCIGNLRQILFFSKLTKKKGRMGQLSIHENYMLCIKCNAGNAYHKRRLSLWRKSCKVLMMMKG